MGGGGTLLHLQEQPHQPDQRVGGNLSLSLSHTHTQHTISGGVVVWLNARVGGGGTFLRLQEQPHQPDQRVGGNLSLSLSHADTLFLSPSFWRWLHLQKQSYIHH